MSSDSEENTDQHQVFKDSDSDSNISGSTVYFSDEYDSNVSWLLMGYQRLFFLLSLLAHHIPRFFCYLFTTKLFRFKTIVYNSSCIYLNFILAICNISSTNRYHCSWIQTITYNRLQRYLRKWRFSLAHLNKNIDIYLKLTYNLLNVTSYFPHQEHNPVGIHMVPGSGKEHPW